MIDALSPTCPPDIDAPGASPAETQPRRVAMSLEDIERRLKALEDVEEIKRLKAR